MHIKRRFHQAGDYLARLANAKFVRFPKSPPNILKVFTKRYPLSPNVVRSPRVLGMFKIPAIIWRPDIFTQNPKTVAVFPKIFIKLWKTIRRVRQMLANCPSLFATFAICSPNSCQVVPNSPIDRHASQMFVEPSWSNAPYTYSQTRGFLPNISQLIACLVRYLPMGYIYLRKLLPIHQKLQKKNYARRRHHGYVL